MIVIIWKENFSDESVLLAGSMFLIFSAPVLIIAFLAIAYLIISGEEEPYRYAYVASKE